MVYDRCDIGWGRRFQRAALRQEREKRLREMLPQWSVRFHGKPCDKLANEPVKCLRLPRWFVVLAFDKLDFVLDSVPKRRMS